MGQNFFERKTPLHAGLSIFGFFLTKGNGSLRTVEFEGHENGENRDRH